MEWAAARWAIHVSGLKFLGLKEVVMALLVCWQGLLIACGTSHSGDGRDEDGRLIECAWTQMG